MYEIHWSAFCCDTGYYGGTDTAESFADALAEWAARNDTYLADGPMGAVIYRNGKEVVPARAAWAEVERVRLSLAETVGKFAAREEWAMVKLLAEGAEKRLAELRAEARATYAKWLNVGNRERARRNGGFNENHAAWLGEEAALLAS